MKFFIIVTFLICLHSISCWPRFLFYKRYPNSKLTVLSSTDNIIGVETFDPSIPTVFIVHGFTSNGLEQSFQSMKHKFLSYIEPNLIVVDWEAGAALNASTDLVGYTRAASNTRIVGKAISDFIIRNKIKPASVTCIGHSLGAHVCAFAGKNTPGFGRISGIDPAGPLFKDQDKNNRLDASDAKQTDCIFTTHVTGILDPICHQNFYPNFLLLQPQCQPINVICLHGAGIEYYLNTIRNDCKFMSAKCDSSVNYLAGKCQCTNELNCIRMGWYAKDYPKARGSFYLKTLEKAPYCSDRN